MYTPVSCTPKNILFSIFFIALLFNTSIASAEYVSTGNGGVSESISPSLQNMSMSNMLEPAMSIQSVTPASDLNLFTVTTIKGDYSARGVGLRGKNSGTINLSDIPPDAIVKHAYLYWSYLDNGRTDSQRTVSLNGSFVDGVEIGDGNDTCWGYEHSRAFRADVTGLVAGNGTYTVSSITNAYPLLAQGASLVVIYEAPTSPERMILIHDGNAVIDFYNTSLSTTIGGFTAGDTGSGVSAKTTFVVGDGQEFSDTITFSGSNGVYVGDTQLVGSDGDFWDTISVDVSNLMRDGDTSALATVSRGTDCLNWVAQVFSVTSDGNVLEPALSLVNPILTEDDGVQDAKGVADKTNFTFSVTAQGNPDSVLLVVDGSPYTMIKNDTEWSITKTFPKGTHSWLFRAVKGTTIAETEPQQITTGYSNVAFFHGIQASRLYVGNNKIWLPNYGSGFRLGGNADVELAAFNEHGESISNVHTRDEDIINKAGGFTHVYHGFIEFMDDLERVGIINNWKPIAYDWRLNYFDILNSGVIDGNKISYLDELADGDVPYIIAELQKLQKTSDSGKVTIVTHSNGGLLAKTLLSEIEKDTNLYHDLYAKVDKLVMVAAPQLGTPKSYESMLHGGGNSVSAFRVDDHVWRNTSRNMPVAYDLLPSKRYFESIKDSDLTSMFVFGSSLDRLAATINHRDNLGYTGKYLDSVYDYRNGKTGTTTITTHEDFVAFLLGKEGRPEPDGKDIIHPVILQSNLIAKAISTHERIDSWMPGDFDGDSEPDIEVIQIAGWGRPDTVYGIQYQTKDKQLAACIDSIHTCKDLPGVHAEPLFTSYGDETVVLQSAVPMPVETWYVDLQTLETASDKRKHANIMGAGPVQGLLFSTITNKVRTGGRGGHASTTVPSGAHIVQLSMLSPADMHVYDTYGNHTGLAIDEEGREYFEEGIQGSAVKRFGESVYMFFPANKTYRVELDGTGTGTFTFKIKETIDGTLVDEVVFQDVPVREESVGTILIGTIEQTGSLVYDYNGDGIDDLILIKGTQVSAEEYLDILDNTLLDMNIYEPAKTILRQHVLLTQKLLEQRNRFGDNPRFQTVYKNLTNNIDESLDRLDDMAIMYLQKGWVHDDDYITIMRFIDLVRKSIVS